MKPETILLLTHKDEQLNGIDLLEIERESDGALYIYVRDPFGAGASFDLNAQECRQVAAALLAEADRMESE